MIKFSKILPFLGHGDKLLNLLGHPYFISRYQLRRALLNINFKFIPHDILDVGCGSMPYRDLFPSSSCYEGLEIDQPRNRSNPLVSHFYNGTDFPLSDNSFDVVLCSQVLEHCFTPDSLLSEISRVLRPGGYLILTIPFFWPEHEQPYDSQRYTSFGLRKLVDRAGLKTLHLEKTNIGLSAMIQLTIDYLESLLRPLQRHSRFWLLTTRIILLPPYAFANMSSLIYNWLLRLLCFESEKAMYLDIVLLASKV